MSGEKAASKASMGMIKGESEIQSDVLRCLYDLLVGGITGWWYTYNVGPPSYKLVYKPP